MKVLIKEYGSEDIVKVIECSTQRQAEKVDDGININLNHDKYYTVIEKDNHPTPGE